MADHDINILIRAKDLASKVVGGVDKKLGGLGKTVGRLGSSIATGLVRVGTGVAVGIVGGVAAGIRSLDGLDRAVQQTKAVIASTKGVAGVSLAKVRELAEGLESVTTADDKAILGAENMLLTFTGIGAKTFPRATKAAVNLAIAMAGGDVENANFKASAIQVGKALQDPVKGMTALRKSGVSFTEAQIKQVKALVKAGKVEQAQTVILRELEKEFGKAGEAAGKGPGAAWRRLKDIGEDLSMALARGVLPALMKVADWLGKKLADPAVESTLEGIGEALGGMVDQGLAFVDKIDFGKVLEMAKGVKDAAGTVVGLFTHLPPWVQQAVITGWGLNKLTGGILGDVVGELGKGLVKGVLGMTAGVVNIKAGVVNGGGGGAPGAAGGAAGLAGALAVGVIILGVAESAREAFQFHEERQGIKAETPGLSNTEALAVQLSQMTEAQRTMAFRQGAGNEFLRDHTTYLAALQAAENKIAGNTSHMSPDERQALSDQKTATTAAAALAAQKTELVAIGIRAGLTRTAGQIGALAGVGRATTAALTNKRWQFTVNNVIPVTIVNSNRDSFKQTKHQGSTQTIR